MIDKGDDFAGPRPAPRLGATILTSAVVSTIVSAATTFAVLALVPVRSTSELVQSGHVQPPLDTLEGEVYYATPYLSNPHLEILESGMSPKLVEQRKDGFKYKALTGAGFDWRARGQRGGPAPDGAPDVR